MPVIAFALLLFVAGLWIGHGWSRLHIRRLRRHLRMQWLKWDRLTHIYKQTCGALEWQIGRTNKAHADLAEAYRRLRVICQQIEATESDEAQDELLRAYESEMSDVWRWYPHLEVES